MQGALGVIVSKGSFCLGHWETLSLPGLVDTNMARRWLTGVSGDESGRASPGVECRQHRFWGQNDSPDPVPLRPLDSR